MSVSKFSGVLQITDLDDFIAPSQAILCNSFVEVYLISCSGRTGVTERLLHRFHLSCLQHSGRGFQATAVWGAGQVLPMSAFSLPSRTRVKSYPTVRHDGYKLV